MALYRLNSLVLVVSVSWLTACASLPRPYRVEVVQGNVLTQEQVAQIKVGQTRDQVREILGSPLLVDPFHANRWDYVFTIKRQGTASQQHRVIAVFEGDALRALDGAANLPTETDFVRSINTLKHSSPGASLTLTPEQIKALPASKQTPAVTPQALPLLPRTYPALEQS
jgi:outer membrane protein assembly factor BamE